MDSGSWLGIVLLALLMAILGLVAAAEAGLGGACSKVPGLRRGRFRQLADQGITGARAAADLLQIPQLIVPTLSVLRVMVTVGIVSLTILLLRKWIVFSGGMMVVVALGIFAALASFQLLVTALAARDAERVALMSAPWIVPVTWLFRPVARLFRLPVAGVSEEDSWDFIEEEHEGGSLQKEERQMVRSIFEMEQTTAREIMVPRIDVAAVDTDASLSQAVEVIVERGYSRLPLYRDTIDNVVCVVYAKDILRELGKGNATARLEDIARPAHFIPESKKIHELLREFQEKRVHMAIIVDEYGGTEGLVTIEDLLEEIVGEIEDEYDREEPRIQRVSDTESIVDARLDIDSFNEEFGVAIEEEYFDTVGGFVYNKLGKIPSVGDAIQADGLTISVLSTLGRRIRKIRVARIVPPDTSFPGIPE